MTLHVFVNLDLKVDADLAIGPDDDVSANTDRLGHVTAGIGDAAAREEALTLHRW